MSAAPSGTLAGLALACAGCGATLPADAPYPYRCPCAGSGDGRDHVMRVPENGEWPAADLTSAQPFVRYRTRLWSYALARARGISDGGYVRMVETLDSAVAEVDGRGFRVTPFAPADVLAGRLGLRPNHLWIKDETGNVSGSHKGRHLFGLAVALEVAERTGLTTRAESDRRGLAIASCGNAALAAAVVARAATRPLTVFIPEDANRRVVARLEALGAKVAVCRRERGVAGDPCLHAFHAAAAAGALPFCGQGSENGLTIEGGETLAWEIVDQLREREETLDRLFVQVGGGALASAVAQGLRGVRERGLLARLPRLHPVQTAGGAPLRRAWSRLRDDLLAATPARTPGAAASSGAGAADADGTAAEALLALGSAAHERALAHAQGHRADYMWPWETPPASVAHGILDDETYDWAEVLRGTLASGGWPVVASEARVSEAHALARATTAIRADATGTAGLAGLLELQAAGARSAGERIALLFTGVER